MNKFGVKILINGHFAEQAIWDEKISDLDLEKCVTYWENKYSSKIEIIKLSQSEIATELFLFESLRLWREYDRNSS